MRKKRSKEEDKYYRLAPKMPTDPSMPKCKSPKDEWEIPSFMKTFKPKKTITFYYEGGSYTEEVDDDEL